MATSTTAAGRARDLERAISEVYGKGRKLDEGGAMCSVYGAGDYYKTGALIFGPSDDSGLGRETAVVWRGRPGDALGNYPWVRCAWGGGTRALAYVARPQRGRRGSYESRGRRAFTLNPEDFLPEGYYVAAADCPSEAILTASIAPGRAAIPAYPVHQMLSRLFAGGAVLTLEDDVLGYSPKPARPIHIGCKATLAALTPEVFSAAKLWVKSYWEAPPANRWRWLCGGGPGR